MLKNNDKNQIKEEVVKYIATHKEVPIYKLETLFEGLEFEYKGNGRLNDADNKYLVYWNKWNKEAYTVVLELVSEGKLKIVATRSVVMLYLLDGKCPNIPLAVPDELETHSWVPIKLKLA